MSGFNDGDWVTVTGYAMSVMSGRCAVIPTDIQLKVVPTLTYDSISDVPAAGISNGLIPVTITNAEGWSVSTTFDGEVVTEASISNEEITYTVSKNTTPLRRSGAIGVWFSKSGEETVTFSIPINQEAAEVEGTATLVLDGEGLAQLAGGNNYGEVKTGTIDGFTWESTGYRTSTLQNMLQLRKRDQNDDVSYIKLPTFPGNILQVVMKVTRTSANAYSTSEADESTSVFAVQSGTTNTETVLVTATAGGGTVTLDLSEKNVKTGYIVLNDGTYGARVWEISVLYNKE